MKGKKIKIKKLPLLIMLFTLIPILGFALFYTKSLKPEVETPDHITEEVIEPTIPILNETKKIVYPYAASDVTVAKSFYDYKGSEEDQIKSITMHDNTYIQNTGIDFTSENEFDVIAILEGTIVDVKDDDNLGKTIQIKHDNGYVSSYQSLKEVNVKKGDIVGQGQVLGRSGTNELDKELGNHLHLEIYINGQAVNPMDYLDKELNIEKEN